MRISTFVSIALVLSAGVLTGCGQDFDPLTREGLWHPAHVNRADLVMQAANPSDLIMGKGAPSSDGQLAAAAIERLRQGKVKKLQDSGIAEIAVQSSGSSDGAAPTSSSQ